MTRSTFSGFTIAQLAMTASQRAIDVTGQNIANINTQGYTRQRVDLVSLNTRGADAMRTGPGTKIGYGVEITGISQIRDPFLDVQFRNQIAKVGTADARQATLDQLADIFDETDDEGIKRALSDFKSSLDKLASNAGSSEFDSIVRSRAQVLVNYIHQKSTDLKSVREETINGLENSDVPTINGLLSDIGELNDAIWKSQVQGNPALELLDERNNKLDELASYLPISVTYNDVVVATGTKFEYPVVKFRGSDGMTYNLTAGEHGENVASISSTRNKGITGEFDGTVSISLIPASDFPKESDVSTLSTDITKYLKEGSLKGVVDALNKSGELDVPSTDFRGIGYYEKSFEAFVQSFAKTFNELNKNTDPSNTKNFDLFQTSDGSLRFTASNIKISDDWMNNSIHIISAYKDEGTTANDNIMRMLKAMDEERVFKYEYTYKDSSGMIQSDYITHYTGSFSQCYSNLENTQGIDSSANSAILNNHVSVLQQTSNNKDSVSGVSLDEEGISLMQYQRSFSAAARLMTTLDEALNILINSTGLVGR
ncbi:MAG: flagellar hook-associated protein FlgK [Lacrimispora sp.]|uniref:flagellar hook-associated protein FlgK n=1 Tax=Lacrimispora sp. TaxID=2719234 RepID=UPI0039E22891